MKTEALLDMTAELLREFRHAGAPADRVLGDYTRRKKFLGSKERRFVGDTFYHAVRHLIRIDESLRVALENAPYTEWLSWRTGFPATDPRFLKVWSEKGEPRMKISPIDDWFDLMRVALAAEDREPGFIQQYHEKFFESFPKKGEQWFPDRRVNNILERCAEVMRLLASERKPHRFPLKHSLPEWLWGLIGYGLSPSELDKAATALNDSARPCLRVNTLKTTREVYLDELKKAEIEGTPGKLCPEAVILDHRMSPGQIPGMNEGIVEFQDEGSQFISHVLGVTTGSTIVDACAGAGGKTLHLAALTQNQSLIIAHDISMGRLENLQKRAIAAGATNIQVLTPDEEYKGPPADLVLIDAPCSGIGTTRRSPELKWRVTREVLEQRLKVQAELMHKWSSVVAEGGVLAYATCSLLRDENGGQIDKFLGRNKSFERLKFGEGGIVLRNMLTPDGDIQLYPHRHQTDGFFISRIRRTAP